jgi:hypothetical protein
MYGPEFFLKHQALEAHFRELLNEAEQRRAVEIALGARPAQRGNFAPARVAVANVLFRAGSWIMPEEAVDGRGRSVNHALELQPGQ